MTTDNSRADALTPCVHADDPKSCYRVRCQLGGKCIDDDMSPRQPAAAPFPKLHCQNGGDVCLAGNRDGVCCPEDTCDIDCAVRKDPRVSPTAPSPADERAAFDRAKERADFDAWYESAGSPCFGNMKAAMWLAWQSRAASASETGAEGAKDLAERAHLAAGAWANANTPIAEALAYRDGFIAGARSPAMAAEAVAIPAGYALVPIEPTPEILTAIWQNERDSRRAWERAIATVQQPAQAHARVGLTAEQRASITWAIRAAVECGYTADADALRALLQGANHA